MKKLIVLLVAAMFTFVWPALAKDYVAVTPDDTVESIDQVQVQETDLVTAKRFLTLTYIDTELAVLNTEAVRIQSRIATLTALRVTVAAEAVKVKLKVKIEEPKEPK